MLTRGALLAFSRSSSTWSTIDHLYPSRQVCFYARRLPPSPPFNLFTSSCLPPCSSNGTIQTPYLSVYLSVLLCRNPPVLPVVQTQKTFFSLFFTTLSLTHTLYPPTYKTKIPFHLPPPPPPLPPCPNLYIDRRRATLNARAHAQQPFIFYALKLISHHHHAVNSIHHKSTPPPALPKQIKTFGRSRACAAARCEPPMTNGQRLTTDMIVQRAFG
ncbi:uncharacterized protein IWZ02DRAFT_27234 [Phyllosticta citriasiana]|uniref:uncharacterized protein n=1 Tax=Phyllosticta citriasiana TaxID=595635 RepID=UPI0030FD6F27